MLSGRSQSSVASVPNTVDALLLAARGSTEVRAFRLTDLPRLSDLAVDEQAQARLTARFHLVDSRVGVVGRATASLNLVCQRCLGAVLVPVDDEFHVVLVASEDELGQLPETQDAMVADASKFELSWLLEEQLLLALPLVPAHATSDDCVASTDAMARASSVADEPKGPVVMTLETQRPFANLRDLLNTGPQKGPKGSSGRGE